MKTATYKELIQHAKDMEEMERAASQKERTELLFRENPGFDPGDEEVEKSPTWFQMNEANKRAMEGVEPEKHEPDFYPDGSIRF